MAHATRGEPRFLDALTEHVESGLASGRSGAAFVELDGTPAYFKFGPLRGRARLRHSLRSALGIAPPRLNEFENLRWLREHDFDAPRPLAAGVVQRFGLPTFQYLACEEVRGALTLRALFEGGERTLRATALSALGRSLGRLHELGFVHRDLFPRNLLVTGTPEDTRVHYIDAWRGGPGRNLRGPAYDLGCLMLHGVELFDDESRARLLDAYFEARDASLDRAALLASAARERRALARRLARRGRTEPPLPDRDWSPD